MKRAWSVAVVSLLGVSVWLPTSAAAPPQVPAVDTVVKSALEGLFAARCSVITGGSANQLSQYYAATPEATNRVQYDSQYLVKQYVEPYAYNNYTISNCRYELQNLKVTVTGNTAEVSATPVLRYDWGRPDWTTKVTTGESEGLHTLTFSLSSGVPKIVRHQYTDFLKGVLPTKPFAPAAISNPGVRAAATTASAYSPTGKSEWTLADKLKEEQAKSNASAVTIQSTTATYDWIGAATYAANWALARNAHYPDYSSDDCTNFVSQSIHDSNGGKAPFWEGPDQMTNWVAKQDVFGTWGSSPPWRLVVDFRNMVLAGTHGPHGTWIGTPNSLVRGDIMSFKLGGSADWIHNTIVTGYAPDGTDLLSYHSNDTLNRPWNTIVADAITAISMDTTFNY